MPNCFTCGRKIPEESRLIRKRVKTGEHVRKGYSTSRTSSVQSSFGMRIVCKRCADDLDRRAFWAEAKKDAWIVGALILLLLMFLFPNWF